MSCKKKHVLTLKHHMQFTSASWRCRVRLVVTGHSHCPIELQCPGKERATPNHSAATSEKNKKYIDIDILILIYWYWYWHIDIDILILILILVWIWLLKASNMWEARLPLVASQPRCTGGSQPRCTGGSQPTCFVALGDDDGASGTLSAAAEALKCTTEELRYAQKFCCDELDERTLMAALPAASTVDVNRDCKCEQRVESKSRSSSAPCIYLLFFYLHLLSTLSVCLSVCLSVRPSVRLSSWIGYFDGHMLACFVGWLVRIIPRMHSARHLIDPFQRFCTKKIAEIWRTRARIWPDAPALKREC